jgi:hypothetical protein
MSLRYQAEWKANSRCNVSEAPRQAPGKEREP